MKSRPLARLNAPLKWVCGIAVLASVFAVKAVPWPNKPLATNLTATPMTMLIAGRDHKLFYEAYNDASDIDGDGTMDIRFKPSIVYFGLFDSTLCYSFSGTQAKDSTGNNGLFTPAGTADAQGRCTSSTAEWSGNWLNYVTTSRIDALRKVLYGGYREVDSETETILRRAYIPQDAHTWAKEYTSTTVDGYAIEDYTALAQPTGTGTRRHFFGNLTFNQDTNCKVLDDCSNLPPVLSVVTNTEKRVWEWASTERPVLRENSGTHGGTGPSYYAVRVKVCSSGYTNGCRQYNNGQYKPVGLLHEYGENNAMLFGLITGSYDKNMTGGLLRKVVSSFADEVNSNTGIFTSSARIVHTFDSLRIRDFNNNNTSREYRGGWQTTSAMTEGNFPDWGNPIAEMMYEGIRYFAGKKGATSSFMPSSRPIDTAVFGSANNANTDTWDDPYDTVNSKAKAAWCARANFLTISDINPSFDSNDLPGVYSAFSTGFIGDIAGLNVETLGNTITSVESNITGKRFIGQSESSFDSSPKDKTVSSLGSIRGLAPEEPTKQGSYYSASLAYYARSTDLRSDVIKKQSVDTFSVALASPLPTISATLPNGRVITMVPFAKSVQGSSISSIKGNFQPTNQIVDFYVDTIANSGTGDQNSSINDGRYYAKFRINFEDVEQGADHDMDAIAEYEVVANSDNTLSIRVTPTYEAGGIQHHMGYIISGTTQDGVYLVARDESNTGSYFLNVPAGRTPGYCDTATPPADCATLPAITNSSNVAATSIDGISWTQRTLPANISWSGVAYGGGTFVAVAGAGADSNIAATSTDGGITWTQRTLPASTRWSSVTYGGGRFVAVAGAGANTNIAATSTDGITWTQRTLPASTRWRSVTFGGGTFVAVAGATGADTNIAATSTDGITWTQRTLPTSTRWRSVTYGGGTFVAVAGGDTSTNIAATSSNGGLTWTQRTLPASRAWSSVTYGGASGSERFVAVAGISSATTTAATSSDGITWTQRALPASATWSSVAYGNGQFVALSGTNSNSTSSSTAASSPDGVTWTQRSTPVNTSWSSVTFGDGRFVSVSGTAGIPTYTFSPSSSGAATFLKDPLWYAAKWGGAQDRNSNGQPDLAAEWDSDNDGVPDTYFLVQNPLKLQAALRRAFDSIVSRTGGGGNVIANSRVLSTSLSTETLVFQGVFNTSKWAGNLIAYPATAATGIGGPKWNAAQKMPKPADREIFYSTASGSGAKLPTGTVPTDLSSYINSVDNNGMNNSVDLLRYLRGDSSKELANAGGIFRDRATTTTLDGGTPIPLLDAARLGDITHSSPVYVKDTKTVYVGANDGMLHAFDAGVDDPATTTIDEGANSGRELFAFIPSAVLPRLKNLSKLTFDEQHEFFVDGDIAVSTRTQTTGKNHLVAALGRGGKGLFGLDVTNVGSATGFAAGDIKWEYFDGATDPDLGYMLGRPIIAQMNNGQWAVLVGNGYESNSGLAALYVFKLDDGTLLKKFTLSSAGTGNGLATPGAYDRNDDGKIDFIYAGDLKGNVWKFDVSGATPGTWDVANKPSAAAAPLPIFVARDGTGKAQPITAPVTAAKNTVTGDPNKDQVHIFFGTGSYYRVTDPNNKDTQTWYSIIDRAPAAPSTTTSLLRSNMVQRSVLESGTFAGKAVRTFGAVPLSGFDTGGKDGCFIDLPVAGERMVTASNLYRLAEPTLIASSIIPVIDQCEPGGTGYVNAVSPFTCGSLGKPFFDVNNNSIFTDDLLVGKNIGSLDLGVGMPGEAIIVGNRLVVGGSEGTLESVRINSGAIRPKGRISWREIISN